MNIANPDLFQEDPLTIIILMKKEEPMDSAGNGITPHALIRMIVNFSMKSPHTAGIKVDVEISEPAAFTM